MESGKGVFWTQHRIHILSRSIICFSVTVSLATLFHQPSNASAYLLDLALRSYLMFAGCVMAHEGSHGHLGRSRAANFWWGRVALIPTTVPYVSFRKTHPLHHAHTNIPDSDPDHFIKPGNFLEVPFRCLALPHHWFLWLLKNRRMKRWELVEWALHYVIVAALFGAILIAVGTWRLISAMAPSFVVVSILLWYFFAIKTHEGFSVGDAEERSHNYYGRGVYWFSLGLSMHRAHHIHEGLTWLELRDYVKVEPANFWRSLALRRDIRAARGVPDARS